VIPVTLDSIDQQALPYWWDREPLTLRVRVENDVVDGLTKRSARRSLSSSLRCELDYGIIVDSEIAATIRNAITSSTEDLPVRVPFWPGLGDDGTNYGSNQWARFEANEVPGDISSLTWHSSAPSLTGQQTRVPTLRGHLIGSPSFELLSPSLVQMRIRWRESSTYAERLTLPSWSFTDGPVVGSITPKLFPLMVDFSRMPDPGAVLLDASREQIGFGREAGSEVYPQLGTYQPKQSFTFSDEAEVSKLLKFFLDRQGAVEPFWLPSWLEDCRLAADTSSGSADITVTDASALGRIRFLLFRDGDGNHVVRKINSIASNTLTLASTPGTLDKDTTLICPLLLVRFASSQLTLSLENVNYGTADVTFEEVPEEYTVAAGETRGTTIGALTKKAYLYEFCGCHATGYEDTLTDSTTDHIPIPIEHGEIQDNPLTEQSRVSLRFRYTNPGGELDGVVDAYLGLTFERRTCIISECDPANVIATKSVIFHGYVTRLTKDGPFFNLEAVGAGGLFERRFPRTLLQPGDNWELFSDANGLDIADWTFTANATSQTGTAVTLNTFTWPGGALPTIGANYFALGYIVRPSTGEKIPILSSTAISAGAVTLTLATAPTPAVSGTESGGNAWSVIPGYDGTLDTATDKFANEDYFGGFKFAPATNPSLVPVKKDNTSTGKK
jgi:hypothetical protein